MTTEPVGLIAGGRQLPVSAARKVKAQGRPLVVAGLRGEADPELRRLADHWLEVPLGQIEPLPPFFLRHGVRRVCMAGAISRTTVVEAYEPDAAAIRLMESLPTLQTDAVLRAAAGWLETFGLELVSVVELAPEILIQPGQLTRQAPAPELLADLKLAFRLAKELGRLDCGQTAVVSDRIAVALEGADGTDATIRRGAALCRKPVAVAKVVKPQQDLRLDLPVVGPETFETLVECGAGALALDAGRLIMLEAEKCLSAADQAGLAVVAWLDEPPRDGADA
ncbi:MAG: UDP-2,3-diacylglucosamine diphosphatase LpxI [Deltaproteobacteria bacterium]|jgi:DUF1009 family protein|nr:UDP-2,3-diacylglucosamine diphosphatase LpxI [Deltaproteobacteria bacterium]